MSLIRRLLRGRSKAVVSLTGIGTMSAYNRLLAMIKEDGLGVTCIYSLKGIILKILLRRKGPTLPAALEVRKPAEPGCVFFYSIAERAEVHRRITDF